MTLRNPTRALQRGFLALLAIATAQVAWWIADQINLAEQERDELAALYEADAQAVSAMLAASADPALTQQLKAMKPHLAINTAGKVRVHPAAEAELAAEVYSRINRYAWEGGFFLLVLLGGMAVLTRAIRQDARLRRRQQNFLATVSHEFKSPLASMRLSAETLALRAEDEDSRRLGRRLVEDGNRLLNMVDNLLDATRIDEGELKLRPAAVPLAEVAQTTLDQIGEAAAAHGIALRCEVPPELHLQADREVLETVLHNLLDNAFKACVAGRGQSIAITAAQQGKQAVIHVADDGVGFAPSEAKRLFDKFHRLPDSQLPGSGLGLYIVARLTALSAASVAAQSAGPGEGAEVKLTWPIAA